MKKTYFAPETLIVTVSTQQMIATSPGSVEELGEGGGTITLPGEGDDAPEGGDAWSRRRGLWNDED